MNMTAPRQMEGDAYNPGVDYFDPDTTMITTLRRATANAQDLLLRLEGVGELLLLSKRGEYFPFINDEEAFFSAPLDAVKVTILGKGAHGIPSIDTIGRNIDELMWKAAYYASAGRLMSGCYPADMVELAYWPNLTRLPHSSNTARIVALLMRHATPITFAARLLKISPQEIYRFYSAARCAGLARPLNRTPEEPRLEPHRNQTLLSSLLKKITSL